MNTIRIAEVTIDLSDYLGLMESLQLIGEHYNKDAAWAARIFLSTWLGKYSAEESIALLIAHFSDVPQD